MISALASSIPNKISTQGWAGILLSLSMLLSLKGDWRIPIGGTLMHPYLGVLPFLLVIGKIRLFHIEKMLLYPLMFYGVFFSFPMILEGSYSEVLKIFAGIVTLLFFAQCVQSEKDIEKCTWGFILSGIWLSLQVIFMSQSRDVVLLEGVNALSGLGNKNAQSQFTIPAFIFTCFNFFNHYKNKRYLWAFLYIGLSIPIILGSALTGNRSGVLSLAATLLILVAAFRFNFSSVIIFILMISISYYLVMNFAAETFERKYEQTTSGKFYSDQFRKQLIVESIYTGLEHPFPGLGFKGLAKSLAERLNLRYRNEIDPHNLYGYLLGAGGVLTFSFLIWFLKRIISKTVKYQKIRDNLRWRLPVNFQDRRINIWLIGFICIFLFRSFFTRELIYSPNFMGGLGLLMGCLFFYHRKLYYVAKR